MKEGYFLRPMVLVCFVLILSTVGGVFATWKFAEDSSLSVYDNCTVDLGEFTWEGSEVLPDDVQGEDHAWLIQNLINGKNSSGSVIGLDNSNSKLNDYINDRLDGGWGWKRDYFGSMAVTGNSEIESLFGAAASGLSFIIQVVSDTEYYIYTTSVYLGERGEMNWLQTSNKTPGKPSVPIGEYIYAVYRTRLTRANTNNPWNIVETKEGKAKSDWYDENRSNANITQIPSFDINTWTEGTMGTAPNSDSAIWTFIGDDPTAYPGSATAQIYYRIKPSSAGTRTITSSNANAKFVVYDQNMTQIAVSSAVNNGDGTVTVSVSWTGSANTLYYIAVSGSTSIHFTVS